MQLVNLTPHSVNLFTPAGVQSVPASGQLTRVRGHSQPAGEVFGLPVVRPTFEPVTGLPEPVEGVLYLVSSVVLTALKSCGLHRTDVVAPATGPNDGAIRDSANRVQGVTRLLCM